MAKNESKTEQRSGRIVGRRYRYTEDYKVLPALGGPGGRGKRVIYTAPWIVPELDAGNWQKLVRALRTLTALAVLAYVASFCAVPPPMENKWYVPVLALGAFPLAYQVSGSSTTRASSVCTTAPSLLSCSFASPPSALRSARFLLRQGSCRRPPSRRATPPLQCCWS